MTREEAIGILKKISYHVRYDDEYGILFTHEFVGAYEMAINALRDLEKLESHSKEDGE